MRRHIGFLRDDNEHGTDPRSDQKLPTPRKTFTAALGSFQEWLAAAEKLGYKNPDVIDGLCLQAQRKYAEIMAIDPDGDLEVLALQQKTAKALITHNLRLREIDKLKSSGAFNPTGDIGFVTTDEKSKEALNGVPGKPDFVVPDADEELSDE